MTGPTALRMNWLDALRVFAGICIVALHAATDINGQPFPAYEPLERAFPVLFRTLSHIARSELFMIISLFLLCFRLDRRPDVTYLDTIKYQASRLLPAFALWVVFYAFFRLIKATQFGYADAIVDQLQVPSNWAGYFFLGDVQYHMHFIPTLFGMILLYPGYHLALRYPQLGLAVLVCLFAKYHVDGFLWGNLKDMAGFDYLVRATKILTYAGYGFVAFSLCGLLKKRLDKEACQQMLLVAITIAAMFLLLKLVGAYKITMTGRWQYGYMAGWWADFLMPACVFLIFLSTQQMNWPGIFSKLARYTFGVYLIHPAMLDLVDLNIASFDFSPTLQVLAKFTLGFPMTLAAVWIISRISLLAWTVGLGPLPTLRFKNKEQHLPNASTS